MKSVSRLLSTVAWLAACQSFILVADIPVANAQQPSSGSSVRAPAARRSQITEQKLDATAAAFGRIIELQRAFRQRLAEASTPPDQERIATEVNDAVTKAVNDEGLSLEEYTSILEVAQNDPEVREKVLQRLGPLPDNPN
jgi:hypothetical protein